MKKRILILTTLLLSATAFAQQKTVQVVMPECVNITGNEAVWLPGQIQDKLKSNLQEYLGMRTVVDSKSEATLKKLQRESESTGRDENTAIELGKITTAQFAIMTKIRHTAKGYTINIDYTDLKTGEQKATVTSIEYATIDKLYENTGAVDEITLALAEKLNIAINPLQRQALRSGTADFTLEEQLALTRQNEERFNRLMAQFDDQLRELSLSNSLNAMENSKKIEAEKALLAEKQQTEKRRLAELEARKVQADEDAKLESERTAAQRKKRDELARQATEKVAEVRKLKMENQSVFGQISIIESKKKALVEIREKVEERCNDLYYQLESDKNEKALEIRCKPYSAAELEDGYPLPSAVDRRNKLIDAEHEKLTEQFLKDADAVQKAAEEQESSLLSEIRSDQKSLSKKRTVSSIEELNVSYGTYSGGSQGWNVYISFYSEGELLYSDNFVISYEKLTGKKAINFSTATDSEFADYETTVDMYNSLFTRDFPILYYELDYVIEALPDKEPSCYKYTFQTVRVINTMTDETIQTERVNKTLRYAITPACDIRKKKTIDAIAYAKGQTPTVEKQQKKKAEREAENARKKAEYEAEMSAKPGFYQTKGGGGMGGLGTSISFLGYTAWNCYLDLALLPYLFLDCGFSIGTNPYSFGEYIGSGENTGIKIDLGNYSVRYFVGIGLNARLHINGLHPAVYYLFDVGHVGVKQSYEKQSRSYGGLAKTFSLTHSFGVSFPVAWTENARSLAEFDIRYSLDMYLDYSEYNHFISLGIRWTWHPIACAR